MNALLTLNLGNQRALIRAGSAYGITRILLHILFALQVVGCAAIAAAVWVPSVAVIWKAPAAGPAVALVPVLITLALFPYLALSFLVWALAQAVLDMADAALASVPERQSVETFS